MKIKGLTFNQNPLLSQLLPAWRSRLVLVMLLLAMVLLCGRSVYLQSINEDFLQQKGESRFSRVVEMPATRGRISDRAGEVLAMSTPVKAVALLPEFAKFEPQQVRKLSALLDMDVRELDQKLVSNKDFVYLKRQVAPDVAEKVARLNLPGIQLLREYRRYYPAGDVSAHMLGFTSVEDRGQEGIELAFDKQLAGKPGSRRVIRDRRGAVVEEPESIRSPQDGRDVQLALDSKIQYLAYTALKQALTDHRAKAGGVVVLDAKTGEVLALANLPTYNPNNAGRRSGAQLRNRALTDTFEPGSTIKPFVAALALERGKFAFNTPIQTAPGRITIGNSTISDAKQHGVLSVAEVIQKSSNVGTVKMALSFAPEEMWSMYRNLGFGTPLKLGFPGEVGGRLRPAKTWKPIEQATMAYGHGMSVSLMQLAHAYLVFARDGDLVPLTLIRASTEAPEGKRVFSRKTVLQVRAMLEMATATGGTAPQAQVPGYRVAGKTGTAHKLERGQYVNKYVSSFVGLAPASDPRLVVAVMIDEPSNGKHYGGEVAAPVFANVVGGALRSLGVVPDAPMAPMQVARNAPVPPRESM